MLKIFLKKKSLKIKLGMGKSLYIRILTSLLRFRTMENSHLKIITKTNLNQNPKAFLTFYKKGFEGELQTYDFT